MQLQRAVHRGHANDQHDAGGAQTQPEELQRP